MPYHHTELIRLLEQRHHPFPSDPASITEILRQADGTPEAKLHRRAQLIDRDQHIAQRLAQHQQRLRFARRVACAAWFIIGLLGTYQLMQQSSLNFMLILVGILGGNSLMLIIWLISLTQKYRAPTSIPLWLTGSLKDPKLPEKKPRSDYWKENHAPARNPACRTAGRRAKRQPSADLA